MPTSFEINADENLILANFEGELSPADIIAHVEKVNSDPGFVPGMNSLADLSEAVIRWDYWEMDRFRDYLRKLGPVRGVCKWAIICGGGVTPSTAQMIKILYEAWEPVIEIKIFSNASEAMAWINPTEG